MQRNVTRTAQLIDLCPDCRSVLKLAVIEAHPDHDKMRIYHLRCENGEVHTFSFSQIPQSRPGQPPSLG